MSTLIPDTHTTKNWPAAWMSIGVLSNNPHTTKNWPAADEYGGSWVTGDPSLISCCKRLVQVADLDRIHVGESWLKLQTYIEFMLETCGLCRRPKVNTCWRLMVQVADLNRFHAGDPQFKLQSYIKFMQETQGSSCRPR